MTAKLDGTNGLIQSYDYQTPTTGFSYTFAAGTQVLVMNPAGTLATGTITMPASPADGMTITFSSSQQITALTMAGNGASINSAITSLGAKQAVSYVYRATGTTWYILGTQATQATGPAVSAYPSATATISSATYTKVILNTEDFDTANAFDSTTNYRFTPLVAGYYQVNLVASMNQVASSSTNSLVALYKNGTLYKTGGNANNTGQAANSSWSGIVSLNGSTDYIEMYVYTNSANVSLVAANTNFSACLIRGA